MIEDGNSSILLAIVVFMVSVLVMSLFSVYEWSDINKSGKALVASVRVLVDDEKEKENEIKQSMVLGVQNVQPVNFVNYPVVHISSGARSVFESVAND